MFSCTKKNNRTDFLLLVHNKDMDTIDVCIVYRGDKNIAFCDTLTKKDSVIWRGEIYKNGDSPNSYTAKVMKLRAGGLLKASDDNWIASIHLSYKGETINDGAGTIFKDKHYEVINIVGEGTKSGILSNGTNFIPKEYSKWIIEPLDPLTKEYLGQ